jgi:hypothetical protein
MWAGSQSQGQRMRSGNGAANPSASRTLALPIPAHACPVSSPRFVARRAGGGEELARRTVAAAVPLARAAPGMGARGTCRPSGGSSSVSLFRKRFRCPKSAGTRGRVPRWHHALVLVRDARPGRRRGLAPARPAPRTHALSRTSAARGGCSSRPLSHRSVYAENGGGARPIRHMIQ